VKDDIRTDMCVIGAGSGGLSVAAGASQMGADTVLIEGGKMGGDCLNYGCVPSKSLLAAGAVAQTMRDGEPFGIAASVPDVRFGQVHAHVHEVIAGIAPHDSVERFESLGVRVIQDYARFVAPDRVQAGGKTIRARRFVVATGSSPALPPITGIEQVPVLTNETAFDLTEAPTHLIVIGGGPIGLEMAQAHRRLGCRVTVVEMVKALGADDPEMTAIVLDKLRAEGIDIRENTGVRRLSATDSGAAVTVGTAESETTIEGSHVLVAAGRRPNLERLDLHAAGIEHSAQGIVVDRRLRTSNRKVYAIGDVAGGLQFTHVAGYHAGIVIRNALFRLPTKTGDKAVPWVTYTDPELAHVGLNEAAARDRHGDTRVLRFPFAENDRARAERRTEGMIKAVTTKRGKILGATIVGLHAGELLLPWVLAIDRGLPISAMATAIAPYPTLSEVSKRVAGSYYTDSLFSPRTRRLVKLLSIFG